MDDKRVTCMKCARMAVGRQSIEADIAGIARKLARRPDSARLKELLTKSQENLARAKHIEDEHKKECDA
jgi:hypothetical protein